MWLLFACWTLSRTIVHSGQNGPYAQAHKYENFWGTKLAVAYAEFCSGDYILKRESWSPFFVIRSNYRSSITLRHTKSNTLCYYVTVWGGSRSFHFQNTQHLLNIPSLNSLFKVKRPGAIAHEPLKYVTGSWSDVSNIKIRMLRAMTLALTVTADVWISQGCSN